MATAAALHTVFLPRQLTEDEKQKGHFSKWLRCPRCDKDLITDVLETFQCDVCEVMQYCSEACRDDPVSKQHVCAPCMDKMRGMCHDFVRDYRDAYELIRHISKEPRADGLLPVPDAGVRELLDARFDALGEYMQCSLAFAPVNPLMFESPVVKNEIVPAREKALAKYLNLAFILERVIAIEETPESYAASLPNYNLPEAERVNALFENMLPETFGTMSLLIDQCIEELAPDDPARQREARIEMNVYLERVYIVMATVQQATEFDDPDALLVRLAATDGALFDAQITDTDELVQLFFEDDEDEDEFHDTPEWTFTGRGGVARRMSNAVRVKNWGWIGRALQFVADCFGGSVVSKLKLPMATVFAASAEAAANLCVGQSALSTNMQDVAKNTLSMLKNEGKQKFEFRRITGGEVATATFNVTQIARGDHQTHAFMELGIVSPEALEKYMEQLKIPLDGSAYFAQYTGHVHYAHAGPSTIPTYSAANSITHGTFTNMIDMSMAAFILRLGNTEQEAWQTSFFARDDWFDLLVLYMTIRSTIGLLKFATGFAVNYYRYKDDYDDPLVVHEAIYNLGNSIYKDFRPHDEEEFFREMLTVYRLYERGKTYHEILYKPITGHPNKNDKLKNVKIYKAIKEERKLIASHTSESTKLTQMLGRHVTTSTATRLLELASNLVYGRPNLGLTYKQVRDNPLNLTRERVMWWEFAIAPMGLVYLLGKNAFGNQGRLHVFYLLYQGVVSPITQVVSTFDALNKMMALSYSAFAVEFFKHHTWLSGAFAVGFMAIGLFRIFVPLTLFYGAGWIYNGVAKKYRKLFGEKVDKKEEKRQIASRDARFGDIFNPYAWVLAFVRRFLWTDPKSITRDQDIIAANFMYAGLKTFAYYSARIVVTNYMLGEPLMTLQWSLYLPELLAVFTGDWRSLFAHQAVSIVTSAGPAFWNPVYTYFPSLFQANAPPRQRFLHKSLGELGVKKPMLSLPPPPPVPVVQDDTLDIQAMAQDAVVSNAAFEKIIGDFCAQQHAKNPAEWTTTANDMRLIFDELRLACGDLVANMAEYGETGNPELLIKNDFGASPPPPAFARLTSAIVAFGRVISAPIDGVRHFKTDADTPAAAVPVPFFEQLADLKYKEMEHALTVALMETRAEYRESEPPPSSSDTSSLFEGKKKKKNEKKQARRDAWDQPPPPPVKVLTVGDAPAEASRLVKGFTKMGLLVGSIASGLFFRTASAAATVVSKEALYNTTHGLYTVVNVTKTSNSTAIIEATGHFAGAIADELPMERGTFRILTQLFLEKFMAFFGAMVTPVSKDNAMDYFRRTVTLESIQSYLSTNIPLEQRGALANGIYRAVTEHNVGVISLKGIPPDQLYREVVNSLMRSAHQNLTVLAENYVLGQPVAITTELNATLGLVAETINTTVTPPIVEKVASNVSTILNDTKTAVLKTAQGYELSDRLQGLAKLIEAVILNQGPADADTTATILAFIMSAWNMYPYMLYSKEERFYRFADATSHQDGFKFGKFGRSLLPYAVPLGINLVYMIMGNSSWLSNKATYMLASQGIMELATQLAAWRTVANKGSYVGQLHAETNPMGYLTRTLGFTKDIMPFLMGMQLRGTREVDVHGWALAATTTASAMATTVLSTGLLALTRRTLGRTAVIGPNGSIRSAGDVPKKVLGNVIHVLPALAATMVDSNMVYMQLATAIASTSFVDEYTPYIGNWSQTIYRLQWLALSAQFGASAYTDISSRRVPGRIIDHSTALVELARRRLFDDREQFAPRSSMAPFGPATAPPMSLADTQPVHIGYPFPDLRITDPRYPVSLAGTPFGPPEHDVDQLRFNPRMVFSPLNGTRAIPPMCIMPPPPPPFGPLTSQEMWPTSPASNTTLPMGPLTWANMWPTCVGFGDPKLREAVNNMPAGDTKTYMTTLINGLNTLKERAAANLPGTQITVAQTAGALTAGLVAFVGAAAGF